MCHQCLIRHPSWFLCVINYFYTVIKSFLFTCTLLAAEYLLKREIAWICDACGCSLLAALVSSALLEPFLVPGLSSLRQFWGKRPGLQADAFLPAFPPVPVLAGVPLISFTVASTEQCFGFVLTTVLIVWRLCVVTAFVGHPPLAWVMEQRRQAQLFPLQANPFWLAPTMNLCCSASYWPIKFPTTRRDYTLLSNFLSPMSFPARGQLWAACHYEIRRCWPVAALQATGKWE